MYHQEEFTDDERAVLLRFFTNTDRPVFALINLPEVVKGALFARYSRTHKSLRRLFLDEFYGDTETGIAEALEDGDTVQLDAGIARADRLYDRVFSEYGDDSVAQLGGAHIACEQASNLLTKVLEWGRLAAYLEQSTRYIFYDRKLGGRYRYHIPAELAGGPLEEEYRARMDGLFETYSAVVHNLVPYFERAFPKQDSDSESVWRASIRAKACDAARGLLPAATLSNVGIFASGQAYETMLIRMRSHPLAEAREYAGMMLEELRKVIPAFLRRVDRPERGGAWSRYLADTASRMGELAHSLDAEPRDRPEVTLVDWDEEAESKVAAAALYAHSDLPDDQLLELARQMPAEERRRIILTYSGDRENRRHKPGRGMERVYYRFDIKCDFGSFRDLQRHRMLTLDWQRLTTRHGHVTPEAVREIGEARRWDDAMGSMAELHGQLAAAYGHDAAQYAVPFACRVRFVMQMNAREAFHLLELRTARAGHPDYRRVCQEMRRLIRDQAGHRTIADAMSFVDTEDYGGSGLERIEAERRSEARRQGRML
ncbi:MAG: FAD-dependent thymidylate synthase [Chloroflexota bacterium]